MFKNLIIIHPLGIFLSGILIWIYIFYYFYPIKNRGTYESKEKMDCAVRSDEPPCY
jgi:hypothetical protein